jgi:HEAT repeat protein
MDTFGVFTRWLAVVAVAGLMTAAAAQAQDSPQVVQEKEQQYLKVLQSDAPGAEKALACKQLSLYGSAAAVPELAKLLSSEQLASWARIALEAIPDSAADEALRKSLASLQGRLLVGAINSIGVRRDTQAVNILIDLLKAKDAEVASAAAVALGNIGNAPAAKALQQSLAAAPALARDAFAEGCILCAERQLAADQASTAVALYDLVRQADLPKQKLLEATRGAILARKSQGVALLVEQLRSADKQFFQLALGTSREIPGSEVAKALAAELVGSSPDRAALVLQALADRHDTGMLPAVLEAAASGPKQVRLAAIEVLPRLGNDTCFEPLLRIATGEDAELAKAAKDSIAILPGESINADIRARLAKAQGSALPMLIELVGLRRIEATDTLVAATKNNDAAVRAAALTALGATVGLKDLPILIAQATAPTHADDAKAAQQALRAACIRMPEGEACAEQLVAVMAKSPLATKTTLLEILGAMGGAKSLETLAAAGKGSDPELQDVATRVLGEWMNLDAAPVLLDLAKNAPGEKYQVRSLRGYIRLARQFVKPDGLRVEMCQKAFAAAQRPAEKKLVLEVLGRSQSMAALKMAAKAAEDPELKEDAVRAASAIAARLGDKPEVRDLMTKLRAN